MAGRADVRKLLGKTKSRRRAEINLSTGDVFEMFWVPLTIEEENKIREAVSSDARADAYGIKVLVNKAEHEDGTKMFTVGDIGFLRNEVAKRDLEEMMLSLINNSGALLDADMKSTGERAEK